MTTFAVRGRETLIRDARNGRTIANLTVPAHAMAPVWESNRTLLVVGSERRRSTIFRLHLDGQVELATPIRERSRYRQVHWVFPAS